MTKKPYKTEPRHNPATRPASATGQWLYGWFSFALAVFLFVSIPSQTTYFEGVEWFNQPRTWPTFAILGMLIFGALQLLYLRKYQEEDNVLPFAEDFRLLMGAFEMAFWFALYIYSVGFFGYLPSSIAFAAFMTWRMGYKGAKYYLWAILAAVAIVVIFKVFLQVKIPGGEIYNRLPDGAQSFMKTYF